MRRLFAVAAVALCVTASSHVASAASPPPVHNWTGFYIGANIGGGWGNQNVDYAANDFISTIVFTFGGEPPPASFNSSGIVGGLQLGYNWQLESRWLVGFETDFDGAGIKGSGSTSGAYAPYFIAPFVAPVEQRVTWFGTVRARLGYLPVDNLLVYATGGFAYGRVEQSASWITSNGFAVGGGGFDLGCISTPTCFSGSSSRIATGWTLGGGVEYALWQNWRLRGEYLYVSLTGNSLTASSVAFSPPDVPSSYTANFGRTRFNVIRIGLNYSFR